MSDISQQKPLLPHKPKIIGVKKVRFLHSGTYALREWPEGIRCASDVSLFRVDRWVPARPIDRSFVVGLAQTKGGWHPVETHANLGLWYGFEEEDRINLTSGDELVNYNVVIIRHMNMSKEECLRVVASYFE